MNMTRNIVGKNIRKYRKVRGYTQEQLAVYAEMGSYHLSRIELGKENVTIDTLVKICETLEINPKKLFDEGD